MTNVNSIAREGVYGILVDGDGNLIAHKDPKLTLKSATELAANLTKTEIQRLATAGKSVQMTISGQESIVYLAPIPGYDWYFGLVYDKATAFAESDQQLWSSLLATLLQLLIVAGGAALIITRALRPLAAMGDAVAELSQGHGDLTRRIKIKSDDEIGAVARQINLFIEMLQTMMATLPTQPASSMGKPGSHTT